MTLGFDCHTGGCIQRPSLLPTTAFPSVCEPCVIPAVKFDLLSVEDHRIAMLSAKTFFQGVIYIGLWLSAPRDQPNRGATGWHWLWRLRRLLLLVLLVLLMLLLRCRG